MMSIGYHYTSAECWEKIRQEGLQPYRIQRPVLRRYTGSATAYGIWIWTHRLTGRSHIGSILYQMSTKAEYVAVFLRVQYDPAFVLTDRTGRADIHLHHGGAFGRMEYHDGSETAVIVTEPIAPDSIELLNTYHFDQAWSD